jgi:hypothetical protein
MQLAKYTCSCRYILTIQHLGHNFSVVPFQNLDDPGGLRVGQTRLNPTLTVRRESRPCSENYRVEHVQCQVKTLCD